MALNRSLGRDVHFYDISEPDKALGGLLTFFFALAILIISESPYEVYLRGNEMPLRPTDEPLQSGEYDIKLTSPHARIVITNEWYITRILSYTASSRDESFRQRVREREGKCVIADHDTGINSCQNGLLMATHVHALFDNFSISVNVDDDYKIVTFNDDHLNIGGRRLDPVCRDPNSEQSARDELLRWHFRQAVLANMRGAGEPIFEFDFPP
ncbi:hypothetical protein V1520DRAFT_372136 [Lipomyces starkeyi]